MNKRIRFFKAAAEVFFVLLIFFVGSVRCAYGQSDAGADNSAQPVSGKGNMPYFAPGGSGGSFRRVILDRTELYVLLEGKFDDNIYRTSSQREMDFITTISPGVKYSFESLNIGQKEKIPIVLSFEAKFNFVYYKNNPELNQQYSSNLFTPTVSAALDVDRLSVYFNGRSELENRTDVDPEENQDNRRFLSVWDSKAGVSYTIGPENMKFKFGYDHSRRLYLEDDYDSGDRASNRVYLRSSFGLPAGRQITATCDYNLSQFNDGRDGKLRNGNCWIGIGGPFGRKLRGSGNIGVAILSPEGDDGFGELDLEKPIYEVSLNYMLSKRAVVDLSASRTAGYDDPFSAGTNTINTTSLFYDDVPVTTDSFGIAVSYKPPLGLEKPDKLGVTLGAKYEKVDYALRGDSVNYSANLGASYRVNDYCSLSGHYSFIKREGSEFVSSYADNQVILTLRLGY